MNAHPVPVPAGLLEPGIFADLDRPDPLEAQLGDPSDPGNPLSCHAFLTADERGDLLAAGEAALDRYGLGAEFVPRSLGGRLDRMDRLARVLRPVFRRDAALALGHGASNFVGAVNVWTDGDKAQQEWLAGVLLRNGRVSVAYTDLDSGNDVTAASFRAVARGGDLVLSGRKEIINNLGRAEAISVLARTDDEPGSRSHSLLLLDREALPRDGFDLLPRYRTVGVRAMYLGGMAFRDCPVPRSSLVGEPGQALETILRAFQLTRAALPGAAIGGLDAQLRTVLDFAVSRRLYSRAVTFMPHARGLLAGAFVDLLISDCLTTVAARALHLLPELTSLYAAAVKYFAPLLMRQSVDDLAVVLGARSFLRSGEHAMFQKHLRDLPVAALVHAGGTVCRAMMIVQLPRISRSWDGSAQCPPALFRLDAQLPELKPASLELTARGSDALLSVLWEVRDGLSPAEPVRALCDTFLAEVADLRTQLGQLAPRDRTMLASPAAFRLADRYAVVLAAAACAGVWWHNPGQPSRFLQDDAWLVAALTRLARRLGRAEDWSGAYEAMVPELLARHEKHRAFDLVGRRLA